MNKKKKSSRKISQNRPRTWALSLQQAQSESKKYKNLPRSILLSKVIAAFKKKK